MNLTLPSNSSEAYYPQNTLTEYRTHLATPLIFETSTEVALSEISVPTVWSSTVKNDSICIILLRSKDALEEWKCVRNGENINSEGQCILEMENQPDIVSDTKKIDINWSEMSENIPEYGEFETDGGSGLKHKTINVDVGDTDGDGVTNFEEHQVLTTFSAPPKNKEDIYINLWRTMVELEKRGIDFTNESEIKHLISTGTNQQILRTKFNNLEYPGVFKTSRSLINYLNDLVVQTPKNKKHMFTDYFNKNHKIFKLDKWSNCVILEPPKYCAVFLSANLAHLLGFGNGQSFLNRQISPASIDLYGDIHSMYVYSDVIENRAVGDTMAQLLRVVPVDRTGKHGLSQTISFKHLQFFPIRSNYIDNIGIYLRDRAGRHIPLLRGEVTTSLLIRAKDSI